LFASLVIPASLSLAQAQAPAQGHDGYWWGNNTEEFRLGFVTGYVMAMVSVSDSNLFKCLADRNGGKIPAEYPGEEALHSCADSTRVEGFDLGGYRVGQWLDGINEFYKDFRNRGLDVKLAIRYVRGQLHGQPADELEKEVTEWRRSAAPK
jgi:hypothetical protein